jgi:hypothetical protein
VALLCHDDDHGVKPPLRNPGLVEDAIKVYRTRRDAEAAAR